MATKSKNTTRLDFRLSQSNKELIEDAATVCGQSLTAFVSSILVQFARQTLRENSVTTLSNRDRDIFMAMLDAEAEPNEALVRAVQGAREGA